MTNAIEKRGRKGANQYTTSIWYIRCEEKENVENQEKISFFKYMVLI